MSPAEPGDAAAIAELLEELGRFYGAGEPEPFNQRVGQINEAIFAEPPASVLSEHPSKVFYRVDFGAGQLPRGRHPRP